MTKEQNENGYGIGVDGFLDSVYEASRVAVLDGFEELAGQVTGNLEEFHGYEDVDLSYTGPMVETFAGPVMDGPSIGNSRSYQLATESEETSFEISVEDSSMAFMESGEGLALDAGNEYRDLEFTREEGSKQLYSDFVEEFRNVLAVDSSRYRRNEETGRWQFKFQREDVEDLEGL